MTPTINQLIQQNKKAFDDGYFIESANLSYVLINKALKQILRELNLELVENKIKTSNLINCIKKEMPLNPSLKSKLSKKTIKDIELFIELYKLINKELKYQYPKKKFSDTSQLGMNCIVFLNTSLLKIKNNKVN